MSACRHNAGNQTSRNGARQGVTYALGVSAFLILFGLLQETSAQSVGLMPSALLGEINALRVRISHCWTPPPGVTPATRDYVVLRVLLKPDGSLAGSPVLVEDTSSTFRSALANSAIQALVTCQPFTMLKPEDYEHWKDLELKFDPHELLGG
jgi:colicin import membrane protein